ncbi:MAG: DUF1822 family protein [Spirulinaceae cyanobacterium]
MNVQAITDNLTFPIDLTASHQEVARKLSQNKLSSALAKEFYYNILAVCLVKDYLELLGYETDWDSSDFHNPVMSSFADVADLEVKNHGKLECRAVFSDEDIYVRPDAWKDRIGYVFVCLDESQRQQHIIGFVPSVEETEGVISFDQLRSLEDFPEYLSQQEQYEVTTQSIGETIEEKVVVLGQWFKDAKASLQQGWQDAEELLLRQTQSLSYMTRNATGTIDKAKLIDLKINLANRGVMLMITITPQSEERLKIRARLYPASGQKHLPLSLKLEILSEAEKSLKEVTSQWRDYFIQLPEFTCSPGDKFKLRVSLGMASLTEEFIV